MSYDLKLPLVVVVWNDAWVRGEAPVVMSEIRHEHKPMPVTTIGYLLFENEDGIQISNEYYDDSYRGRTFVPKAMIVSVTHHVLAKPRKPRGKAVPQVPEVA